MQKSARIINFLQFKSDKGLEALNRLTGLNWGTMPRSLVNQYNEVVEAVKKPEMCSTAGNKSLTVDMLPGRISQALTGQ